MSLQEMIREVPRLTLDERKQLLMAIVDSLTDETGKPYRILDFHAAAERAPDIDAQVYVNQLREEWNQRP